MMIRLATYVAGSSHLPPDPLPIRVGILAADRRPLHRDERRAMIALFILFIPTSLFWAAYEQQGNTIALWADDYTDRTINLGVWAAELPTTWFQSFNPFIIFAFTPLVVTLWARQAARGRGPSTVIKMALGCAGCGAAYLIMAGAAFYSGDGKASWPGRFAFSGVVATPSLLLSPI